MAKVHLKEVGMAAIKGTLIVLAMVLATVLLTVLVQAYSPFPTFQTNPYYNNLNNFLLGSLDNSTGKLQYGYNSSFYQLNVTQNLTVIGNITAQNVFANNLLIRDDNATLGLWNTTQFDWGILLYPRITNSSLLLGNANTSANYSDTLAVVGSVSVYGSLNSTFLNASRIWQNGFPVLLSKDFNLGNISNYTQYATQSNIRTNITDYLGGVNGSLVLSTNLTSLDTLNNYIRSKDFNIGNISNYTQYTTQSNIRTNITDYLGGQNSSLILVSNLTTLDTVNNYIRTKDFNLQNISNDSLRTVNNGSIALWNSTSTLLGNINKQIYLSDTNSTLIIGSLNTSINWTDLMNIYGSVSVYGTLNATNINASRILINGFAVQLSKDFNLGNISNYTEYLRRTDAFTLGNLSSFFGSDTDINNTLLRRTNTSFFSTFWTLSNFTLAIGNRNASIPDLINNASFFQFTRSSDFNLNNISNNTLKSGDNASFALWNSTSTLLGNINKQVYLSDANNTLVIGNLNTSMNWTDLVNIYGSVATYGSFNATFINATRITATTFLQGGNAVLLSKDFNIGNISNYSQFVKSVDFNLGNISNQTFPPTTQYINNITIFLGNTNATILSGVNNATYLGKLLQNNTDMICNNCTFKKGISAQNISVDFINSTGTINQTVIGNLRFITPNSTCDGIQFKNTGGTLLWCNN